MTDLEWQEQDLIRALQLVDDVRRKHLPSHKMFCGLRDGLVMATEALGNALYEIRYEIEENQPMPVYRPQVAK